MNIILLYVAVICSHIHMNGKDTLKIACWNSRGFRSAVPYLRQLVEDYDVVGVCEHWLHGNRLCALEDVTSSHYVHARASDAASDAHYGSGRGQGGIALFWRKELKSVSVIPNTLFDRACGIRFQNGAGGVCYIWCVYMPAMCADEDLGASLDVLSEIVEGRDPGAELIVLGDFNGDIGGVRGYNTFRAPSPRGVLVSDFMERNDLVALNSLPLATGPIDTHEGPLSSATLDYIMATSSLQGAVRECKVNDWHALNLSDHTSVGATIHMGDIPISTVVDSKTRNICWNKLGPTDRKRLYEDVLEPSLRGILCGVRVMDVTPDNIDKSFEDLTRCVLEGSAKLPRSKYRKHLKPYWNSDLDKLKKDKVVAYREWVAGGRPREREDDLYCKYKLTKKLFSKKLRQLSKSYENEEIIKAVRLAECDRNSFWRLVKRARGKRGVDSLAIRNKDKKVVHEVEEVLHVWEEHFADLGTPKEDPRFDEAHFLRVEEQVKLYNESDDTDEFSMVPFSLKEVEVGLKNLNKGKACGFDGVAAEHLCYAGKTMVSILMHLFEKVRMIEYIPRCFRRGVQIPLFKGKDASPLDPNGYRGITLLSTFNKLFEIVVWKRLEGWWAEVGVVSGLQSACKRGLSCLNASFLLCESIASTIEENDTAYVAFFDVAKAFDSVWVEGLFFQLWQVGIRGKTWRLLYRCYVDFWCVARVQGHVSGWYHLKCGIHQGGYMSLIKYTAFINSLIVSLKDSGLCCCVKRIPSTPVGYADDLAACCRNERKLERTLKVVYQHGCTWRYQYNAKKSGILVYGETPAANAHNSQMRVFMLGEDRVKERLSYEHVGITTCLYETDVSGVQDRIAKARRALNAISGLGIRRNGLSVFTCCIIFWIIVVPIALFGSEMWILNDKSIRLIEEFQNYAGKRIQRLGPKSPNICAFYGLGWIRLERLIEIKKLLFTRSLLALHETEPSRQVFCKRLEEYMEKREECSVNICGSVVFDFLNVADVFGVVDEVVNMARRGHIWSKSAWKRKIWETDGNWIDVTGQCSLDVIAAWN